MGKTQVVVKKLDVTELDLKNLEVVDVDFYKNKFVLLLSIHNVFYYLRDIDYYSSLLFDDININNKVTKILCSKKCDVVH